MQWPLRTSQTRGRARFSGRRWQRGHRKRGGTATTGDLRGTCVHFPVAVDAHHSRKGSMSRGSRRDGSVPQLGWSTARPASPRCTGRCSRGSSHAHLRTGLPGSVHVPEKLHEEVPQSREGVGRAFGASDAISTGRGSRAGPWGQDGHSTHRAPGPREGRVGRAGGETWGL